MTSPGNSARDLGLTYHFLAVPVKVTEDFLMEITKYFVEFIQKLKDQQGPRKSQRRRTN